MARKKIVTAIISNVISKLLDMVRSDLMQEVDSILQI